MRNKWKSIVTPLLQEGLPTSEIQRLTGASRTTINEYRRLLRAGGDLADRAKGRLPIPAEIRREWLEAVNRVRTYAGLEELKEETLEQEAESGQGNTKRQYDG